MAHSLSADCTPLKHTYDSCFNAWFEGYLQPMVQQGPAGTGGRSGLSQAEREKRNREKAAEYEMKCGEAWKSYRACVEKAIQDNGLTTLLNDARAENPLKSPMPAPGSPGSGASGSSASSTSSR